MTIVQCFLQISVGTDFAALTDLARHDNTAVYVHFVAQANRYLEVHEAPDNYAFKYFCRFQCQNSGGIYVK